MPSTSFGLSHLRLTLLNSNYGLTYTLASFVGYPLPAFLRHGVLFLRSGLFAFRCCDTYVDLSQDFSHNLTLHSLIVTAVDDFDLR